MNNKYIKVPVDKLPEKYLLKPIDQTITEVISYLEEEYKAEFVQYFFQQTIKDGVRGGYNFFVLRNIQEKVPVEMKNEEGSVNVGLSPEDIERLAQLLEEKIKLPAPPALYGGEKTPEPEVKKDNTRSTKSKKDINKK